MKNSRRALVPVLAALVVVLVWTQVGFAANQSNDKVFWMTISEVPIEHLQEFHALSAEMMIPVFEDHGCRWVASWQTLIGDAQEVVNVVEFESINAYHRAKVSLLASPEWEHVTNTVRPLVKRTEQRLLSATEYSPLQ